MGRIEALIQLGLTGQDFGPCYTDEWTHGEFSAMWRGTAPCPTESEIEAAKNSIPTPVPQSVSPRQARKALRLQNLLPIVQAAVDAADDDTKDAWEYSTAFERNSPFVASMAAILGLTNEELDNLFIVASSL